MRARPKQRNLPLAWYLVGLALATLTTPLPAAAQHWTFDAREIGLGGARENTSLASTIVPERRPYRSILIPLRLIPVLKDLDVYNPLTDDFDPIRAITNVLNPFHHTFDPGKPSGQVQLFNALLGFALNRDIDVYLAGLLPDIEVLGIDRGGAQHTGPRGSSALGALRAPPVDLAAVDPESFRISLAQSTWTQPYDSVDLLAENWGRTFPVRDSGDVKHAFYVGAGPYLSYQSETALDAAFGAYVDVARTRLSTPTVGATVEMGIEHDSYAQLAVALTGGYRGRWPVAGRPTTGREGIYVAVNTHYLHGFAYEHVGAAYRLEADSARPFGSADKDPVSPGLIERLTSRRGHGFAVDAAVAFAIGRWDFGVGATGLMNRITWTDVRRGAVPVTTENLYEGFGEGAGAPLLEPAEALGSRRVALPMSYTADASYHRRTWTALTNYKRGFLGHYAHAGVEYRLPSLELRAGGRFAGDRWHPAGGVGFELSPGWHLDVGAFGTSLNPERKRTLALALSFRME